MAKFFRLVQNEYIKTIRKISTLIMLAIVIAAGVFMPVLSKLFYKLSEPMESYEQRALEQYLDEIEYAKSSKAEGWEYDVERNQYLYDNKITPFSGWRYEAVSYYYDIKFATDADPQLKADLKATYEKMLDGITKNDYYTYAEGRIAYNEYMLKLQGKDAQAIAEENWEFKYRIDHKAPPENSAVMGMDNISKLASVKVRLASMTDSPSNHAAVKELKEKQKIYEYMLENNIGINTAWTSAWYNITAEGDIQDNANFWGCLFSNTGVINVIAILMIIIAGGIVANEFSNGTVKFLLINPAKRWKVLMAKYFTTVTIGYIMILILFAVSYIASGIFYGFGGESAAYLTCKNDVVASYSPTLMMLLNYLIAGVGMIVSATLAFAVSSMVRSTALSVGLSLFMYFSCGIINSVISLLGFSWGKYLIFANMDLISIINGSSPYFEHTLGLALAVIAVHLFTFLLMAWDGFTKKEI